MSRFGAIKARGLESAATDVQPPTTGLPEKAASRAGKKAVSGYFSHELSRGLHILALEQDSNLQAVMGEAFDDLLRKYGRHPFGER